MVFGCTGQDGSLACYSLLKQGHTVIGISRSFPPDYHYLKKLGIHKSFEIKQMQVDKEVSSFKKMIDFYKPNEIYNLAAQSSVSTSFEEPYTSITSIYQLTLVILEAARQLEFKGTIFFAGSSEVFGNTKKPADLYYPQEPISPYAIAKQASLN